MTNQIPDASIMKTARFAGFMFLFSVTFPVINWVFVLSKLTVMGNVAATANNVTNNLFMFRVGILNELILSVSIAVTAITLYILLKSVNKNLALIALLWRMIEAVITAVFSLAAFISLQISTGEPYYELLTPEKSQLIPGIYLNMHTSISASTSMLFLGLGLTTFNYLFFKSKFIPGALAVFGMISYMLIFLYAIVNILVPEPKSIIQIICWGPSVLFEIAIGLWLLLKGGKVSRK